MNKDNESFKWFGTVTCPRMYPIYLLPSLLIFDESDDDGFTYLDATSFSRGSGWGNPGTIIGGGKRFLPNKLLITWLSWVEAKVYTGTFDLPKERITQLFRDGYMDFRNRRAEYSNIVVGLAPEGAVFVWVWGNMSCVEVARFQAEEQTGVTAKEISQYTKCSTLEELCKYHVVDYPDIMEYIAKHNLNNHIWDTYRERFKIRPIVDYIADGKGITNHIILRFLNGEFQCLNYEYLSENSYVDRARIEFMKIAFSNGNDLFSYELQFDESEIFDAYRLIYGDNPHQEVDLVVRIDPSNRIFRLSLRKKDDDEEVILKNTKIKLYKVDERFRENFRVFNQQ